LKENNDEQTDRPITLLDYLIILLKWKKPFLATLIAFALFSLIIALVIPKKYEGKTNILVSTNKGNSLSLQIVGQLGVPLPGNLLDGSSTSDVYVRLLKSNTVLDRIVERFNLMELYDEEYLDDTRDLLLDALNIRNEKKSSVITVGVEDHDPERAANMANAFVEELKNLNTRLAVTEAAKRRLFFEEQLKDIKEQLVGAEDSMVGFQEKTGAIEIKEQAKAVIESIAQLRAEIAAKEVELKVIKTYTTQRNPDLQKIQDELQGMKEQLAKLEGNEGSGADPLMPTGKMPVTGTGYLRRLRDLKFYETLYELLAKQYEMAKIDEAADAGIIQIVDMAKPPQKKSKPRRLFIVSTGLFLGFLFSMLIVIVLEYIDLVSADPQMERRVERIRQLISRR